MGILVALLMISLWFAWGLFDPLRKRAGERLATWVLPASQAATFRLAYLLARGAGAIAPLAYEPIISYVFRTAPDYPVARIDLPIEIAGDPPFHWGTFPDGEPWAAIPTVPAGTHVRFLDRDDQKYGVANPRLVAIQWVMPRAAIAELDADLTAEKRVAQPIRMVLPLLHESLLIRWRNIIARIVVARARWAIEHGSEHHCQRAASAISRQEICA